MKRVTFAGSSLGKRIGPRHGIRRPNEREVVASDPAAFGECEPWAQPLQMRDAGATGGNVLPKKMTQRV
jgi:hypothetical protein